MQMIIKTEEDVVFNYTFLEYFEGLIAYLQS